MGDDNRCEQRRCMIHGQTIIIMRQRRIRMLLGVCFCFMWLVSVQAGVSGKSSGSRHLLGSGSGSRRAGVSASATRRACSVSMVRGVALLDLIPRGGTGGGRNKSSPENT
eukprot:scaffold2520_cov39-Attheya_sp.AAC.1